MKVLRKHLLILFFVAQAASAGGVYEWDGSPSVYVVGSGGCAKAICAGLAKQEVVPFAGPMQVYRATPMCGAISNGQGKYDCPPADECMAEKTPGIAPVALGKIRPSTPVIIEENWTVPTAGSANGSDESKKGGK